jgi:hypothetical protein
MALQKRQTRAVTAINSPHSGHGKRSTSLSFVSGALRVNPTQRRAKPNRTPLAPTIPHVSRVFASAARL